VADNIQSLLELWIGFLWKTYRLHFFQIQKAFITRLLQTLILKEVFKIILQCFTILFVLI